MTATTLTGTFRSHPIELPVAAFAALAVAFVAFAAPADVLAELVDATGLSAILPAAAPPLGATARIVIGVIGSGLAFAAAFAALRVLDRFASRPAVRAAPVFVEEESPRLRRRDLHPDAPAVRPISAARDFGDPKVPTWLAPAEPDVVAEATPAPESVAAIEQPVAPLAVRQAEPEGLPELMARLEAGLTRRAVPRHEAPQVFPKPTDDRLQSAIESLQRLAARQG
jgi:hypothetical protein